MSFFANIKNENIFVQFIRLLEVKYTKGFANKLYEEHPYKDSLFGLSKMLQKYKIESVGVRLQNKEDIYAFETPFVAPTANSVAIVKKLNRESIHLIMKGESVTVPTDRFFSIWDGILFLAETTKKSCEPNYKKHRGEEFLILLKKLVLAIVVAFLFIVTLTANQILTLGTGIFFLINLMGVYICYLLLLKQIHVDSSYADKICTLFSKSNCNNVLESPASKLAGIIGWSEIGFGYFLSNIFILTFFPQFIHWLALVNMCALPYTCWSIWYQKSRVNEWCPLCILVLILLWMLFVTNLISGYILWPEFVPGDILLILSFYLLPVLIINILLPHITDQRRMHTVVQEMSSLKAKDDVFLTLLKKQTYYPVSRSDSQILWGNRDAPLTITVLTNPHCEPCARMHARIEKFLKEVGDEVCIQYIFSSFYESLYTSSQCLIAVYLDNKFDKEKKKEIYNEWFTTGKGEPEQFFKKYAIGINNPVVVDEHAKHLQWKENIKILATPTILLNGYKIPEMYDIENLLYLTKCNIEN